MIVDINRAQERIKYLDTQINRKQTEIQTLISSLTTSAPKLDANKPMASFTQQTASRSQQVNISSLNTQLSQLKVKIDKSKTYLDQSNHLSHIINSGIASLEQRKSGAQQTLDLFTDCIELRGSTKMVKQSLESCKITNDPKMADGLENLETAAHFTSKSMSLMQVIEEQIQKDGQTSLLPGDVKEFSRLTGEVQQILKQRMTEAIQAEDEATIQKIANLFKSVDEQEEGMKHYTSYILQVKTQKSLESVIQAMYENSNELSNLSDSYAEIYTVLLECINQYSESILQLFDLESLLVFLRQIDKVAKEKGTQVITHFIMQNQLEQNVSELTTAQLPLTDVQQQLCDQLCEEISVFSYVQQNYQNYVMSIVYRQTKNQNTLFQIQKDLQFHMMDELLNSYVELEKVYANHALANGIWTDRQTLVAIVTKQTEVARKKAEGLLDSAQALSEIEKNFEEEELNNDLVDDFCLILEKSAKRSLSTMSIFHSCAFLNFIIDDIFGTQFLSFLDAAFMQITDDQKAIGQSQKLLFKYQIQNLSLLKSEGTFGILVNNQFNATNACLIKQLNRLAQLVRNIDQLNSSLQIECDQIAQMILKDNSRHAEDEEELPDTHTLQLSKQPSSDPHEEQQKFLQAIGFNQSMFTHTLHRLVEETQSAIKKALSSHVHDLVHSSATTDKMIASSAFKFQRRNDSKQTMHTLIEPLGDIDLVLDNAAYEQYDQENTFIGDFVKHANKAVRQFKTGLAPEVFTKFVDELCDLLTTLFKKQILSQKFSLLGALYLEKIIRELKKFLKYLSEKHSVIESLEEIGQLLACENLDEIESFLREQGYGAYVGQRVSSREGSTRMETGEIAELLMTRVDLEMTSQQVYEFLAEINQ